MASQIIVYSQPRSACKSETYSIRLCDSIDIPPGHLLERMLDGQKNAKPFFRPFEEAWHKQQVEWLRLDSYYEGMPSNMRSIFEKEVQENSEQWKEELLNAKKDVSFCCFVSHPAATD